MDTSKLKSYSVLLICKDFNLIPLFEDVIGAIGLNFIVAIDSYEVIGHIEMQPRNIAIIISDIDLDPLDGIDLKKLVDEKWDSIPFVLMGDNVANSEKVKSSRLSFNGFINAPVKEAEVFEVINKVAISQAEELEEEKEILNGFLDEAEMLLEEIEPLMTLISEDGYDEKAIDRIFAIIHTIKGASGFFKPDTVHKFSHKFEDFLSKIKKKEIEINENVSSVLFQSLDYLTKFIEELKSNSNKDYDLDKIAKIYDEENIKFNSLETSLVKEDKVSKINNEKSQAKVREDVRVPVKLLDEFMGLSGEITVLRNMINKLVKSLERVNAGNKDVLLLSELLDEMHKVNTQIQEKIVDLRKVPVDSIYRPLKRVVRDLSRKLNKKVELVTEGNNLKIDTSLAEVLNNSLVHMVRNCVDHGIENKDLRKERGKPEFGTIKICTKEKEDIIEVEIADDGGGINLPKVEEIALKKQIVTSNQLASMSESQRLSLIFEPGFSTADTLTDVSGRGVGTDMLKSSVEKIGGHINIHTEATKGTHFSLNLPMPKSVLILNTLFVKVADQEFAISREEILRLLQLQVNKEKSPFQYLENTKLLNVDGELLPVVDLKDVFKLKSFDPQDKEIINALVIQTKHMKYVLLVDEILDMEDAVVKKLDSMSGRMNGILGATFLGEGMLGLILNVNQIGQMANVCIAEDISADTNLENAISNFEEVSNLNRYIIVELESSFSKYFVNLNDVFRLESFNSSKIQWIGNMPVLIYEGSSLALYDLNELIFSENKTFFDQDNLELKTLVVKLSEGYVGFVVKSIVNLIEVESELLDNVTSLSQIKGNVVWNNQTYVVIDLNDLLYRINHQVKTINHLEGKAVV